MLSSKNIRSKQSITKGDTVMSKTKTTEVVGRQELVGRIAKQVGVSPKRASEILDATLITIKEALQAGEQIHLVGFGSFTVRQKKAGGRGIKAQNREAMSIPTKGHVRLSRSSHLTKPA
jgi:DNA-binding protein HU-beta